MRAIHHSPCRTDLKSDKHGQTESKQITTDSTAMTSPHLTKEKNRDFFYKKVTESYKLY